MTYSNATPAVLQDRSPTIAGLEGLRALAVVAVIVFHADLNHFLPGGFLGVDLFFTLSGYLITALLFAELDRHGTLRLPRFYLRRAKRLVPALLALVLVCTLHTLLWVPDAVRAMQDDLLPALLYYANYWQLLDAQPYFERFGRPHALQHLWSLAIEGQFYLVWPLLILVWFRFRRVLGAGLLAGGLFLAATLWMGWLAEVGNIPYDGKPERLYFGTDTHAIGLLGGALLASLQPQLQRWPAINALALVALAYLLGCFLWLDESSGFLYRGGFASVALASAGLILGAARAGTLVNRVFQHPWAEWVGNRSYSLYLWHWPVFVYFRPGEELPANMVLATLIRLGLTVLLSDLSYRFVEQPVRRQGLAAFGRAARLKLAGGGVVMLIIFGALYLQDAPPPVAEAVPVEVLRPDSLPAMPPAANGTAPADHPPEQYISKAEGLDVYRFELTPVRITALGDSVMRGAKPMLARKLPITTLDAEVGRQGSDLLKLVRQLAAANELADTVLVHIGTNGNIYEQNLKQILSILGERRQLVFINVHADRRWTEENNTLLRRYQKQTGNMILIDWNAAAENHPEYFVKDGIHLTGRGMAAYAELVRVALGLPEVSERPAQSSAETPRPARANPAPAKASAGPRSKAVSAPLPSEPLPEAEAASETGR